MENQEWIPTSEANQLLNAGLCDRTFRDKFRDSLPWRLTPGGKLRWFRPAVEDLARVMPQAC